MLPDGDFTKVRDMNFPRNVLLGHGVLDRTAEVCRTLKLGRKAVIITGKQSYDAAGARVEEILSEDFETSVLDVGGCDAANVADAIAKTKKIGADFAVAVGGGSKIDIAKMVAKDMELPFLSIPTSVAHDGICSDRASVKSKDGSPATVQGLPPTAVIADTGILVEAPYRYLASGIADVISNMTALRDWEFARRMRDEEFSTSAAILSEYSARSLIENAHDIHPGIEECVWLALKPIIASGISMCIAGTSRPTSGSEHMFSHALDVLHPGKALHGEQCGVGCIMMMSLHGGDWKEIRDALKAVGAPTTASELGLSDEDVIDALVAAKDIRKDRFTILGDKGLSRSAARKLAKSTGVI